MNQKIITTNMNDFKNFSQYSKKKTILESDGYNEESSKKEEEYKEETEKKNKVMLPHTLGDETVKELNSRLEDEYHAYFFYINATNWCRGVNYKNATSFFEGESAAELTHAKKMMDYMSDWNIKPTIEKVDVDYKFESLIDVIEKAYEIEYELLKKYNVTSTKIMSDGDVATFDFLSYFRQVQIDEVREYSDLLNALQLIDTNDKYQVLQFEHLYFGK